jgi:hypothetical protein
MNNGEVFTCCLTDRFYRISYDYNVINYAVLYYSKIIDDTIYLSKIPKHLGKWRVKNWKL